VHKNYLFQAIRPQNGSNYAPLLTPSFKAVLKRAAFFVFCHSMVIWSGAL
jgi:hypothetical protein